MVQLSLELAKDLRVYVRPDQPFGPPDAAEIKEPACSAALFDWNNTSFAELLSGSDVLVGRRGSGKSALLSTFKGKRFMNRELSGQEGRAYRERHNLNAKTLTAVPDVVVEADTPDLVDELEQYCRKRQAIPPVEMMARIWNTRIWLLVGTTIRERYSYLWEMLPPSVHNYVCGEDVVQRALADSASLMTKDDYIREMEKCLREAGKRCVVTLDNIERYKFDEVQNAVIGGLIAAAGKLISRQHPSLDVKLCLPAEIFEHLKTIVFRADKDLHKIQYLQWSSAELMHLAACRLKVYFQLYDQEAFERIEDLRLSDRDTLKNFWKRYLPERLVNSIGVEEDTFIYLLRHTQLLPRQLLTSLNAIARRARNDGRALFYYPFNPADIMGGIEDAEDSNTQAILAMFEPMFPLVREILDLVMPRLRPIFDYGDLQSVYNSSAKRSMETMQRGEFRQFWRLMLSTGAIGVIEPSSTSSIYANARFEFNSKHALKISDKDQLCVHPMFARIYNVEKGDDLRIVLPRGSDWGLEE